MVVSVQRGAARAASFRGLFVGRAAELEAARRALCNGESLVTVTGTGGIGKSRFVHEYSERFASDFSDGVIVCDLSEVRDRAELIAHLSRSLGVGAGASADAAVDLLGAALAARGHALLVLDNFEQLVSCASDVVERWLELAPEMRVLVASRERLRLDAEVVVALEPLALPMTEDRIAESEAVELFVDRARRARHDFSVNESNARDIGALVAALDGLPLAIELAAARSSMLDARSLLERLHSGLDVLSHGARTASHRQATMRGALDWSWRLLSDDERSVFAQCSVFRGGFDLAAADAVLLATHGATIFDTLQSLHDKSLLRARTDADDGASRFELFLTVREFAAEKLAELDPHRAAARRHAAHFADLSKRAPRDPACVRRLVRERENVIAAVEHGLAHDDAAELWAIVGLDTALSGRSFDAPATLVERALAVVARDAERELLRGWLLYMRVRLRALDRGCYSDADLEDAKEALAIASQAEDRALTSTAHRAMAHLHVAHGSAVDAVAAARAAIDALRDGDPPALFGASYSTLGTTLLMSGSLREAARALERALAFHEQSGHSLNADLTRGVLGVICVELGDAERARSCLSGQLRFTDRRAAHAHGYLAMLEHDEGALDRAIEHYHAASRLFEAAGAEAQSASFLAFEAFARAQRGESAIARAHIDRSVSVLRPLGAIAVTAVSILSAIEALRDRPDAARAASDEARALLGPSDDRASSASQVFWAHEWAARVKEQSSAGHQSNARALFEQATSLLDSLKCESDGAVVLRIAMRSLQRMLDVPTTAHRDAGTLEPAVLVVHRSGDWFEPVGAARVECYARPVLRALLRALVEQHCARPGEAVSNTALIEAGWPGQKMKPESAKARLHTALKVLRQLGMRDHLRATQGGYVLDASRGLRVD